MLPRIITVAVPRDQHSPRFGHWALWQTVWSLLASTRPRTAAYPGPEGSLALSQEGFRVVSVAVIICGWMP
jgi:hypothetical protein